MQIEAAFSLSEEYYKFMSDFAQTSFEDDKLLGKFYTDFTVAKRMVETIVENVKLDVFSRDIKLIDPFCGDGRLISETIIQLIQKGYMVDRYSFVGDGLFLNENIVQAPDSTNMYKIVWRDVSRDSQVRRIKATLLPPGYICGNSLGVIYGKEDALPYMKMLLAIMNSLIYEFQARSLLVSNHVSAGVVKQIHVPEPIIDDEIIRLVDSQLAGNNVERELEVRTALLYNLSSDEYESVVSSFGITDEEKQQLVENYKDNNEKGDMQNMIYNHYASTLSELDMQVVNCVPPGGNWKDIPESVPSKRLEQIRESYKAGKATMRSSVFKSRRKWNQPLWQRVQVVWLIRCTVLPRPLFSHPLKRRWQTLSLPQTTRIHRL